MIDVDVALGKLLEWNGFREGPNNENPFGPYQGIANQAYCESFADGEVTRTTGYDHRIGLTTSHTQFGAKGDAYTPWGVDHAKERGEWQDDAASQGRPCDLRPGDQVFYAWNNGAGPDPDHVETVTAAYADLTFDTIGANTGSPNGVWHPIRRDRFYLLGRRRPQLYGTPAPPTPDPTPTPTQEDDMTPTYIELGAGRHLIPVGGGPVKNCVVTYAAADPGVTLSRAVAQPSGRALTGLELGIGSTRSFQGRNYDALRDGEESIELWIDGGGPLWLKIESGPNAG